MGLVQLGTWLVGEFGEMLIDGSLKDADGQPLIFTDTEILDVYENILDEHDRKGERSDVIISWTLTALSKLTIRLKKANNRVKDIIQTYKEHANIEIQQRACEYLKLFEKQWDDERNGIFEPIPFKGDEGMLVDQRGRIVDEEDDHTVSQVPVMRTQERKQEVKQAQPLFDIDSMFGSAATTPSQPNVQT